MTDRTASTSDARKRLAESIARLDQRDRFHREWLRAMDETYPPTEPRDQERDMTSPTQRRHEELRDLLAEIRDRLPERPEPMDVTEEPPAAPCGRDVGVATYCPCLLPLGHDGLHSCKHTEPAPDVDPDEALRAALNREIVRQSKSGEVEIEVHNGYGLEAGLARVARQHIYAEPDQSWVTRDIEEAEGYYRVERARAEKAEHERDALRARLDAMRAGIQGGLDESRSMQAEQRSSVTLAFLQGALDDLLEPSETGIPDE